MIQKSDSKENTLYLKAKNYIHAIRKAQKYFNENCCDATWLYTANFAKKRENNCYEVMYSIRYK